MRPMSPTTTERPSRERRARELDGKRAAAAPPTRPGRQRRWSLAVAAILVVVGSALTFAVLWANAGDREPFLAIVNRVPAGQTIAAEDLTVVRVSADPGLDPIPSDRRDEIVGETASTDLLPGTLLTDELVGGEDVVEVGQAIAYVSLRGGRLTTSSLRPGDRVQVVVSATTSGADPTGAVVAEGRVVEIEDLDDATGTQVIAVSVPEADAPAVAGASASEQASVVKVPQ